MKLGIYEFLKELNKRKLSSKEKSEDVIKYAKTRGWKIEECIEKCLYLGIYEMHDVMKYIYNNMEGMRKNKKLTRQMMRLYSQEMEAQHIQRRRKRVTGQAFRSKISKQKKLKIGFISDKYGNFVSSNEYVRILLESCVRDIEPILITSRKVSGYEYYSDRYTYIECNFRDVRVLQEIVNTYELTCIIDLSQSYLKEWWALEEVLILDIWDTVNVGDVDFDFSLNNGLFKCELTGNALDNAVVNSGSRTAFGYPSGNRTFPRIRTRHRKGSSQKITLAAFCRPGKLSRELIELWGKTLLEIPNSELWFKYIGVTKDQIDYHHELFQEIGINSERIKFLATTSTESYLETFNDVDIVLAAAPEGGGISLFDGLAMGKPVVVPMWLISTDQFSQFMRKNVYQEEERMLCYNSKYFIDSCKYFAKKAIENSDEYRAKQLSWRDATIDGPVSEIDKAWDVVYCFIVRSLNKALKGS